jgi:hypothetical protein
MRPQEGVTDTHTSIATPILLSKSFRVATADLASFATLCAKAVSCGVPVVSWVCKYRRAYDTWGRQTN